MADRPIAEGTIRFTPDARSLANVEKSVKKAIGRIEGISARGGLLAKNYVQPLGQITGAADEFTKSLEASNARVIAFGASAGIIYNVQRALTASVSAAINLEKQLADINVILNETNVGLRRFGEELFSIAKNTGQTFNNVSEAALEFARQGLAVEETLKRTRDAMILVRLSGLDVKSSVESITATLNSFNQTVINSTELVNKLANVDAAFAVSSADLAEAIRRVGSSAQDSNVNIDQLIALVTTAQQVTARGGSVIGNSLKTIFTRLQRPQVIADLEAFGIAVKDQSGAMLDTMTVLQNFANTYDKLAPSQKAVTAELVGGVFQINVLKAALGDLGKQYSIYDRALNVSLTSTDQAIARNELLNKTLSTLVNETLVNVQKVGAAFANLTVTPALTNILEAVNSSVEKLEEKAAQGDLGVTFGKGILQGLSNVLSGPALVAIAGILGKLTFSFFKFSSDAVKTFAGLNATANQQKEVQMLIQNLLIKNPSLISAATSSAEGLKLVEAEILKIVQARNVSLNQSAEITRTIAANLSAADLRNINQAVSGGTGTSSQGFIPVASSGFVPNYNRKNEQAEIMGALQGGYMPGKIDTMQIQGIGRVTYNQAEEVKQFPGMDQPAIIPPRESEAGKNYERRFKAAHGFNPYHQGMIPNFEQEKVARTAGKFRTGLISTNADKKDRFSAIINVTRLGKTVEQYAQEANTVVREIMPRTNTPVSERMKNFEIWSDSLGRVDESSLEGIKTHLKKPKVNFKYLNNQIQGILGEVSARNKVGGSLQQGNAFFDIMSSGGQPTEVRTRQTAQLSQVLKKGANSFLAGPPKKSIKDGKIDDISLGRKIGKIGLVVTKNTKLASGGFIPNVEIPNFAYEGLRGEDLGDAFVNVNPNNKAKTIDTNLTQKEITKRIGGKTLIRGPEGETLIFGGDLEGRAGTITVGGLNARKIKKSNAKFAPLLNQMPNLFDGLAYQIMGAIGAKFDPGSTSGAVAGVKFEEEFAEKYGLPDAGARKGSDFVIAEQLAQELGTSKHLQLKLSVFERSKRDIKKVVDVASAFSNYLVHMLTNNIKTQGLSKLVGPERYRQAMAVMNQNPAMKSDWTKYFGQKGIMAGGFVPNFTGDALKAAIGREMAAGYSRSQVKVGYDSRLAASGGIGVYNTSEGSLGRAINMHRASGKSMKDLQTQGASGGYVPNYATDFGDFVGGGLSFALIAPAIQSMVQSSKEFRNERKEEANAIKELTEAVAKAKESVGEHAEELESAQQKASRASELEQKASEKVQAMRDRIAKGPQETDTGLLGVTNFRKRAIEDLKIEGKLGPGGPRKASGKGGGTKGRDEDQALVREKVVELARRKQEAEQFNRELELDKATIGAEEAKLAALKQQVEKHEENVELLNKKNEATKGVTEAEEKLKKEQEAQAANRKNSMNRTVSRFGTGVAFAAPMIAGQASTLFQAAGGSAVGAAGINALGTGLGTAGALGTTAAEIGTNALESDAFKNMQEGGLKNFVGGAARFAGPIAAVAGVGLAINNMGKAIAKAKIKERADQVGKELENVTQQFNRLQQSGQQFMESFDKLKAAFDDPLSTNAGDVQKIQNNLTKALSDAPAEFRDKIRAAAGDADKIREAFGEITNDLQRQQASLKAAQDVANLQADLASGNAFFGGDRTIFEDNAEGKRARSAVKGIVASGLDRGALAEALEAGENIDLSGRDLGRFFGEDFSASISELSGADQQVVKGIIDSLFSDIKKSAQDAAKVTADLKRRQLAEKAYQSQLKQFNSQLESLTATLAKSAERATANIRHLVALNDSFKDFTLDFEKTRAQESKRLLTPFLTDQQKVRSEAETRQFEIRANSIKEMRKAVSDGAFNALNITTQEFQKIASKVEAATKNLGQGQSRELLTQLQRDSKALNALTPVMEKAFTTFANNPKKLDALNGISNDIKQTLISAQYSRERAEALTAILTESVKANTDATTNKLAEIINQQKQQLALAELTAFYQQEEAKMSARIASFGGAGDFGRSGQTNLSGNFSKLTDALSSSISAAISGGIVELGRANSQILDTLLNNMNLDSLRGDLSGLSPLLGPAIAGRSADITGQLAFAERLASIQGVDVDTSGVDSAQIAIEQIASQLKLKDLPDHVADIAKNQAILNSIIVQQAADIATKNRVAFSEALRQNGLHHLDDNTKIAAIAGKNTVGVSQQIGATNVEGFKGVIGAIQDDLPSSINTAMTPFVSRFAQIQNTIGQIEAIQGGRKITDQVLEERSKILSRPERLETEQRAKDISNITFENNESFFRKLIQDTDALNTQIAKDQRDVASMDDPESQAFVSDREASLKKARQPLQDKVTKARQAGIKTFGSEEALDRAIKLLRESQADVGGDFSLATSRLGKELTNLRARLRDSRDAQQNINATKQSAREYAKAEGLVFNEAKLSFRPAESIFEQATGRPEEKIDPNIPNTQPGSRASMLMGGIPRYEPSAAEKAKMQELENAQIQQARAEGKRQDAEAIKAGNRASEAAARANILFDFNPETNVRGTGSGGDSQALTRFGGILDEDPTALRNASVKELQLKIKQAKKKLKQVDIDEKTLKEEGDLTEIQQDVLNNRRASQSTLIDTLESLKSIATKDEEMQKIREKMLEEGRKQVDTLGTIAADNTRLTDLLQLYADAQRKVASKKAFGAAQEILQLSVTGGDPEQIRSQMRSQFETGINAMTRVDAGNASTGRARAALISQVTQNRRSAALGAFEGAFKKGGEASGLLGTREKAMRRIEGGENPLDVAVELFGKNSKTAIAIREGINSMSLDFVDAAAKLRQADIEDSLSSLVRFTKLAQNGLKSSSEIGSKIDETAKGFIDRGGDIEQISAKLKDLQLERSTKAAEEFGRALELVRKGLGSASSLEQARKNEFDRVFQERSQQGALEVEMFGFGSDGSRLKNERIAAEAQTTKELENKLRLLQDAREEEILTTDELRQKSAELADQMAATGNLSFDAFIGALTSELTYSQADYQKDILALGRDFTRDFKSGMADAFGEAIRGTQNLSEAFEAFLGNMADKMLDKSLDMAVNSMFDGLFGFNKGGLVKGYNSGGIVKGGSGVKDDVPAYLSRGEYVIRKKTVNEYGKDFFDSLNSAKVVAANKGGMIDNTKLTRESASRIFGSKSRNMAAIQAERQRRMSALQGAGIEAYGFKESTGETKKDWLGRDTGQKVLANRVGFRLDFGKPLNENRVKKIQEVVNAYPEVGPFIDTDIFKRSTVEIGGGSSKLKLKNSFIYNETKRPDQGRFVADPRLSTLALNDENNPQNKYKFEKADKFFDYQKDRLEYYADKQKELEEFQEQKSNRRRSFLFGAGAMLFAGGLKGFAKGGQNKEDDIPALLTGGEYVVRKGIVDKYGLNFFENLNRGRISAFNKGGYVAPVTGARPTTEFQGNKSDSGNVELGSTTNNISISVNVENNGAVTTQTNQDGSRNTNAASQEETKQLAERVRGAVIGVLAEQKRPGGMLYGTPGSV